MSDSNGINSSKNKIGIYIIANSIVWGVVIIATAFIVKGTGLMGKFIPLLGAGAVLSVTILPTMLLKKKK